MPEWGCKHLCAWCVLTPIPLSPKPRALGQLTSQKHSHTFSKLPRVRLSLHCEEVAVVVVSYEKNVGSVCEATSSVVRLTLLG